MCGKGRGAVDVCTDIKQCSSGAAWEKKGMGIYIGKRHKDSRVQKKMLVSQELNDDNKK